MARVPDGIGTAALTVAARRTLLDAIDALHAHLDALILIGAQAVYLRSGDADLAVAAYTVDGDLGINPDRLNPDPRLEAALGGAGFTRDVLDRQPQPGTWFRHLTIEGQDVPIAVDLLAPESLTTGGRGARLPPHHASAVRRVPGIELALEDHNVLTVASLEPDVDPREASIRVAGVAALLVAKAYKIRDRANSPKPERLNDKDAADVYRLMTTANAYQVADTLARLSGHPQVGPTAVIGLQLLDDLFVAPRSTGIIMATRALAGSIDPQRVAQNMTAFTAALRP